MEIKKGMDQYQVQNLVDQLERRRDVIIEQQLEITVGDFVNEILVNILVATDEESVQKGLDSLLLDEMQHKEEVSDENSFRL